MVENVRRPHGCISAQVLRTLYLLMCTFNIDMGTLYLYLKIIITTHSFSVTSGRAHQLEADSRTLLR